jgi:hypothetical protein
MENMVQLYYGPDEDDPGNGEHDPGAAVTRPAKTKDMQDRLGKSDSHSAETIPSKSKAMTDRIRDSQDRKAAEDKDR